MAVAAGAFLATTVDYIVVLTVLFAESKVGGLITRDGTSNY